MSSNGLVMLADDECIALVQQHSFGRVAVWSSEFPAVLPVLYATLDGDVVFRTAPGDKLIAAVLGKTVVFEIDAMNPDDHSGWSVNVVGRAAEIVNANERERAEALGLVPWAGNYRDDYVRIHTDHVSGRRILPTSATT